MAGGQTIVTSARLIDGTGSEPIPDAVVVIENGVISEVGSAADSRSRARESSVEVIDGGNRTILPGYIDGHVHLFLDSDGKSLAYRDWEYEETSLLWGLHWAQKALDNGITTLADCGAKGDLGFILKEMLRSSLVVGPDLLVSGPALTTTAGHGYHIIGWEVDSVDELRGAVRRLAKQGADFIKIMATGGFLTPVSNRRRAQYSVRELEAVVEDAHRLRRKVRAHAHATEGIRSCVRAGVDAIAHCNWLGEKEGTIDYDEDTVQEMVEKGLYVDMNTGGVFRTLASRDGGAQDWGIATRWDLIRRMREAGVKVFLSTDGMGDRVPTLPENLVKMVQEAKASVQEVVAMTTSIAAEGLGIADEVGSIEEGKTADLILVDGNPLDDAAALARVDIVMKRGKVVVREGHRTLSSI